MAEKYLNTCTKCGKRFYSPLGFAAHAKECAVERDAAADNLLKKYQEKKGGK